MGKKARPGAGDVRIVLDGEEMVLTPSLEACMAISKMAGDSLVAGCQRCSRLDFEFICDVLAHGLNATSPALKKDLREKVYKTGVIAVSADALLFLRTIMNGGERPVDDEAATILDMIDRVAIALPDALGDYTPVLGELRAKLAAIIEEAGEETEDPLAENPSPSESSTAD